MAKDKIDTIVPPPPEPTAENTLKVKSKTGVVYPIHLYDTAAGAGDSTSGTGVLNIGGKYARMTDNLRMDIVGGGTPLRVKKNGKVYQVAQWGEYVANPASCLYVADTNTGAWAKRDVEWIGDNESAYYEVYWSDSGSNTNFNYLDITIPRNCSVVRLEGYGGQTANNTLFVKVTPGKTYRIVAWRYEKTDTKTYWYTHTEHDGGHSLGTTWYSASKTYVTERGRQLWFAYPNSYDTRIILTNSFTQGSIQMGKMPYHTSKGTRYDDVIVGLTDAPWGNGGFCRICFGKGYYNYEANTPQDTRL